MMPSLPRRALCALMSLALVLGSQAARAEGLPELGDSSAAAFSPHAERKVGEQIFNDVRTREPTYVSDPEIGSYLNAVGGRMAAQVPGGIADFTGPRGFEFFALRDATLNAFAMPGGYIGVHTGLLLSAQSESELASVLAHEISHVTQRHIARSFNASGMSQMAMLLALAVAIMAARSNPDVAMGAAMAGQAAAIQNKLNYSRDFEREADRVGVQLLERSGFDVRAMPSFFNRMLKFGALYDNNAPAYLRTHPLTTERIAAIEDRIAVAPPRPVGDSLEFLLVRAKVRVLSMPAREAIAEFTSRLRAAEPIETLVARYGLTRAHLADGELAQAAAEAAQVARLAREQRQRSPMLDTLQAEIRLAQGHVGEAVALLDNAVAHYPREPAINYLAMDAYLRAGRNDDALRLSREYLTVNPDDPLMHAAQAKTYARLNRPLEEHRAQAESYLLLGQLPRAIEQLELAQRANAGGFHENAQVDARLRELKARHLEQMKASRRDPGS